MAWQSISTARDAGMSLPCVNTPCATRWLLMERTEQEGSHSAGRLLHSCDMSLREMTGLEVRSMLCAASLRHGVQSGGG